MKCLHVFNTILFLILFSLFIWQCSISIIKFLSKKTSFYTTIKSTDTIVYPSVSVCKKFTYEKYLDDLFSNESTTSIVELKKVVVENSWDLEEVFYFLTHPQVYDGLTFPCTTKLDGTDPGKPCMFPFKPDYEPSQEYNKCFTLETSSDICYTRLRENMTSYRSQEARGYWGYCPEKCKGEKAVPNSKYNMAKKENSRIWE